MYLICTEGPKKGQKYPLEKSPLIFGRASTCQVFIPASLVSRRHALIEREEGQLVLYDQDSANGTWVNGERIARHVLKTGDQVQVGPCVFSVHQSGTTQKTEYIKLDLPEERTVAPIQLTGYELLERWEGGMATVHKARYLKTGQIVAIKMLRSRDRYVQDKFIKEIEVGKKLNHPYIVRVYHGGQEDGQWYMVMEFVEGGTLRDRMQAGRPLPLEFALKTISQMCEALAYAHHMGVYHRDIKPANILLTPAGDVKLGDFGIARLAQAVTMTQLGAIVGTPKYMSYEQARGQKVDRRSDIYSLGLILYEALTGRLPFVTSDPLKLIEMHITQKPPSLRRFNPEVPPHLEAVTLKALEKERAKRFQNAGDMAKALGYTFSFESSKTTRIAADRANLRLLAPNARSLKLKSKVTPLGRANINPQDKQMSRTHARIIFRGGCWWLEDNKSANGTYVNKRRIFEPVMLQSGDEVRLGSTILYVKGEEHE